MPSCGLLASLLRPVGNLAASPDRHRRLRFSSRSRFGLFRSLGRSWPPLRIRCATAFRSGRTASPQRLSVGSSSVTTSFCHRPALSGRTAPDGLRGAPPSLRPRPLACPRARMALRAAFLLFGCGPPGLFYGPSGRLPAPLQGPVRHPAVPSLACSAGA